MITQQLELFPMTAKNGETVTVNVYPAGDRGYRATIAGGWWTAYGTTPQKAAEACFASYEAERGAIMYGLGAWQ